MLTGILVSISGVVSGILSGFGLNAAAAFMVSSAGKAVIAGTGVMFFSKFIGKVLSRLIQFFLLFLIGMLLYRNFPTFSSAVDLICDNIEKYIPSLVSLSSVIA